MNLNCELFHTTNELHPMSDSFEYRGVTIPRLWSCADSDRKGQEAVILKVYESGNDDGRLFVILDIEGTTVAGMSMELAVIDGVMSHGWRYAPVVCC
jgi:hypothetical protein